MASTILIAGTFDSKPDEFAYLRERILQHGCNVLTVNVGVMESDSPFPIDVDAGVVASQGGSSLEDLRSAGDRGAAMKCMASGLEKVCRNLFNEGKFDAMIGMGGSGGTSVVSAGMRSIPLGAPKVCLSTIAASDTSAILGSKDIVLIPSITDVSGLNRILRGRIDQAAAAVCGMAAVAHSQSTEDTRADRPLIAASMFGNTTSCVERCRELLDQQGYEVLVFHAVGSGGRTLETLVEDGYVEACLDLTTTEWADELCGGIFSAGTSRLSAAGRVGIPHLIAPGCIDMVNFGPMETVPSRYRESGRLFYEWNPAVTLMRTNIEENRRLGEIFAKTANEAVGRIGFILPLKGVSILDGDGERFCDREADQAMFATLKQHLRADIPVIEVDANINDPVFAQTAVDTMLRWLQEPKP